MNATFKFAQMRIGDADVLVTREDLLLAEDQLRHLVGAAADKLDELKRDGFTLKTPPGLAKVRLGSVGGLLASLEEAPFKLPNFQETLEREIRGALPRSLGDVVNKVIEAISRTVLTLWEAEFHYVPGEPATYGCRMVLGVNFDDVDIPDVGFRLNELVFEIDNLKPAEA